VPLVGEAHDDVQLAAASAKRRNVDRYMSVRRSGLAIEA